MTSMSDSEWLKQTYQTTLKRDPIFAGKLADGRDDPGDADYWLGQLSGGTSRDDVWRIINESPEARELSKNFIDTTSHDNTGGDMDAARAATALGGSAMAEAKKNYTGMFQDFSNRGTIDTTDTTDTTDTSTTAAAKGLTLDDLNSWWDTKESSKPKADKFDQFTEFMGLLGGMGGGMFGGGGVPGFASGGVAAANPYNNFMGFMNAFKSLSGNDSTQGITTGNLN